MKCDLSTTEIADRLDKWTEWAKAGEYYQHIDWTVTYEAARRLREMDAATKRLRRLQAFVKSLPCECHDEYGKPFPAPCDRCVALGRTRKDQAQ